jgi:hypothetical protein
MTPTGLIGPEPGGYKEIPFLNIVSVIFEPNQLGGAKTLNSCAEVEGNHRLRCISHLKTFVCVCVCVCGTGV